VLFVTHRVPYPPTVGSKVRAFHCVEHLTQSGHEVTVASLARTAAEADAGAGIAGYCRDYLLERVRPPVQLVRMAVRLPTPFPSTMGYFHSSRLARRIRVALATTPFDLIMVHSSSAAQYVERVRDVPKIMDFVDMDSRKWLDYAGFKPFPLSLGYWLEGRKMAAAERAIARRFDVSVCVTAAEQAILDGYGLGVPSRWFPNGVDTERFAAAGTDYDPDSLCFVGRMDYYPNVQAMLDFCREVLPLLREARPRVKLQIVGAEPTAPVRALAQIPGVTVTGTVPEVQPYVQRSAASVVPLAIARGIQNKILESMAMGVPVVASPAAARGVDALPGEHLLVAGSPGQYRDALVRLMADPAERHRLAVAGRARMLSHHTWSHAMGRLDSIIAESMDRRHR
jgi:sugar transferase (PEP-CTERM/EpsH1 system associated)